MVNHRYFNVFDFVTRRQRQYDQLYNRHHENYSQNGSVPEDLQELFFN